MRARGTTTTPSRSPTTTSPEATVTPLNPKFPDLAGTYYMHEAAVAGLTGGTCYRYVLSADPAAYTGRFCTGRAPGAALRFLAIGDTNPTLGDNTSLLLPHIVETNPDFVIHGGDLDQVRRLLTLLEPEHGLPSWCAFVFTTTVEGQAALFEGCDDASPSTPRIRWRRCTSVAFAAEPSFFSRPSPRSKRAR